MAEESGSTGFLSTLFRSEPCSPCRGKRDEGGDEGDVPSRYITGEEEKGTDSEADSSMSETPSTLPLVQRRPKKDQSWFGTWPNLFSSTTSGSQARKPKSFRLAVHVIRAAWGFRKAGKGTLPKSETNKGGFNGLGLTANIWKAANRFGKKDAAPPNEQELSRGLQVQQVYDFFDPASKTVRVRKMNEDVLHKRAIRPRRGSVMVQEAIVLDETLSESSLSEEEPSSSSPDRSPQNSPQSSPRDSPRFSEPGRRSSVGDESLPERPKGCRLKRAVTQSDFEVITNWGLIVGKFMHEKMVDFAQLKNKAMRQRANAAQFQTNGTGTTRMVGRLQARAAAVVKQACNLSKKICGPNDIFDAEWSDQMLIVKLFGAEYIDSIILLTKTAVKLVSVQPSLAIARAPCKIFGDIHGQLRDVLMIFRAFGTPQEDPHMHWVFNGDFVDRGAHQVEVIGLLLALKVLYPERVWLVRGNHEDRAMNQRYGFQDQCLRLLGDEFGLKVFELMQNLFNYLPVACLVAEKILCVHGGIGDGAWKLDDIRTLPRPLDGAALTDPQNSWLFNILWSDPIEDGKADDHMIFGVHESPRGGVAARFAWDITKTFCAINGLSLVVRSHQSKRHSRGFDVMHGNLLVRVFSARDYEGHGNDGAVLMVTQEMKEGNPFIFVRPQVVRSVQKARDEAIKRAREEKDAARSPRGPRDDYKSPRDSFMQSPRESKIKSPRESKFTSPRSTVKSPRATASGSQGTRRGSVLHK